MPTKDKSTPAATTARKCKSRNPTTITTLTTAFSNLEGGWSAYIKYVEFSAIHDKDPDMLKLLELYNSLPKSQRNVLPPEHLCQLADIHPSKLLKAITTWVWNYSHNAASIMAAALNPAVVAKTAKSAIGNSKFAYKDRELFLRMTGALPTPKGSETIINKTLILATPGPQQTTGIPLRLPSAAQDVIDLEAADLNDEETSFVPSRSRQP